MLDFQGALQRLNAVIEGEIRKFNLPGLTIGLTNREKLLFVGSFGLANCDAQQAVTPQTLFQIGSISKSFTSIILLQLQERGILNLDDPVSIHLPWFEIQSDYLPIRLRHLMSHTAGIIMGSDATPSAYTEAWDLRYTRATASPGEKFHYSNSGYKILGLVLQACLQQKLADILKERILIPLRMLETEPVITNVMRSRLAVGYEAFYDDRPLPSSGKLAPATWFESDTADGSISSTAEDMCRYLRFLLNRGQGLLQPDSFEQLIQPIIPTADDLHGEMYGLGLSTRQMEGHKVIGHSGGMVGYTADMLADLDAGLGVIVLANGPGNPDMVSQYALQCLLAALNGKPFPDPPFLDPYQVDNSPDYLGQYQCEDKTFIINANEGHLYLDFELDYIQLEPKGKDVFLVNHPAFEMFPLQFGRGTETQNRNNCPIIEVFNGPDWYIHTRYQGEKFIEIPTQWWAYTGHYRSHNPWLTNFWVVIQKNSLVLIHQWDAGQPLHQTSPGKFRVGKDICSPEFIHFDLIIDGKAIRANLSGGAYYRTFTP